MHCAIVNVCCWRDPEETSLRLPVPLLFCVLLHIPPGNHVLHLENIDLLAWAPSPPDLMRLVYALMSVALSDCVAEIHAILRPDLVVLLCASVLLSPFEVPDSVVVRCGVGVAVGVSLALVSAPSEVPAYSDVLSFVCWLQQSYDITHEWKGE